MNFIEDAKYYVKNYLMYNGCGYDSNILKKVDYSKIAGDFKRAGGSARDAADIWQRIVENYFLDDRNLHAIGYRRYHAEYRISGSYRMEILAACDKDAEIVAQQKNLNKKFKNLRNLVKKIVQIN